MKQYCHVHGVHYPTQKIGDIKYHTGTRVYRVLNIREHFPKSLHIFGRWAKVIYVGQPARPRHDNDLQQQNEQIESEIDPNETT